MKNTRMKTSDEKISLILRELFRIEKKMELGFESQKKEFNKLQSSVDAYV